VDGFHARVVQHGCDHLISMLCSGMPVVRDFSRFGFTSVLFPGLDVPQDDWCRPRAFEQFGLYRDLRAVVLQLGAVESGRCRPPARPGWPLWPVAG